MQARFCLPAASEKIPAQPRQPTRPYARKQHRPTCAVAQRRLGIRARQPHRAQHFQLARCNVLTDRGPIQCAGFGQHFGQLMADPQQEHQTHQRNIQRQGDQPRTEVDTRGHAGAIRRDRAGGGVGGR